MNNLYSLHLSLAFRVLGPAAVAALPSAAFAHVGHEHGSTTAFQGFDVFVQGFMHLFQGLDHLAFILAGVLLLRAVLGAAPTRNSVRSNNQAVAEKSLEWSRWLSGAAGIVLLTFQVLVHGLALPASLSSGQSVLFVVGLASSTALISVTLSAVLGAAGKRLIHAFK